MIEISDEETCEAADIPADSSIPENGPLQDAFVEEIDALHHKLVEILSPLGEEGDYYGISDYSIRPGLMGPPPRVRRFVVTIISPEFLATNYLRRLVEFLRRKAPLYVLWIAQDVFPDWSLDIFLTTDEARVCCDNPLEMKKVRSLLESL